MILDVKKTTFRLTRQCLGASHAPWWTLAKTSKQYNISVPNFGNILWHQFCILCIKINKFGQIFVLVMDTFVMSPPVIFGQQVANVWESSKGTVFNETAHKTQKRYFFNMNNIYSHIIHHKHIIHTHYTRTHSSTSKDGWVRAQLSASVCKTENTLNPRTGGGRVSAPPPWGFLRIAKKRRRAAAPNFV